MTVENTGHSTASITGIVAKPIDLLPVNGSGPLQKCNHDMDNAETITDDNAGRVEKVEAQDRQRLHAIIRLPPSCDGLSFDAIVSIKFACHDPLHLPCSQEKYVKVPINK